jgi:hypothetical protein
MWRFIRTTLAERFQGIPSKWYFDGAGERMEVAFFLILNLIQDPGWCRSSVRGNWRAEALLGAGP